MGGCTHHGCESHELLLREAFLGLEKEAARALEAVDLVEAGRLADGHGVGRESGGEVQARAHFDHLPPRGGAHLTALRQLLGLEGLLQEPASDSSSVVWR